MLSDKQKKERHQEREPRFRYSVKNNVFSRQFKFHRVTIRLRESWELLMSAILLIFIAPLYSKLCEVFDYSPHDGRKLLLFLNQQPHISLPHCPVLRNQFCDKGFFPPATSLLRPNFREHENKRGRFSLVINMEFNSCWLHWVENQEDEGENIKATWN